MSPPRTWSPGSYGGLPTVGGFRAFTEFEIGAQLIAEAAHCILGSIQKVYHVLDKLPDWHDVEQGHILEEWGIIYKTQLEYGRPIYRTRFNALEQAGYKPQYLDQTRDYNVQSVASIRTAGAKLKVTAEKYLHQLARDKSVPLDWANLAGAAYAVAFNVADAYIEAVKAWPEGKITNPFTHPKFQQSLRVLEQYIRKIYGDDVLTSEKHQYDLAHKRRSEHDWREARHNPSYKKGAARPGLDQQERALVRGATSGVMQDYLAWQAQETAGEQEPPKKFKRGEAVWVATRQKTKRAAVVESYSPVTWSYRVRYLDNDRAGTNIKRERMRQRVPEEPESEARHNPWRGRTLYHGTIKDREKSILEIGLVPDPEAWGQAVEHFSSQGGGAVFAASKKGLDNAVGAMRHHIAQKLNKRYGLTDVTPIEVERHGMLVVIKEVEVGDYLYDEDKWRREPGDDDRPFYDPENVPASVERGDYFFTGDQGVAVDFVLKGKKMMQFLARHGALDDLKVRRW